MPGWVVSLSADEVETSHFPVVLPSASICQNYLLGVLVSPEKSFNLRSLGKEQEEGDSKLDFQHSGSQVVESLSTSLSRQTPKLTFSGTCFPRQGLSWLASPRAKLFSAGRERNSILVALRGEEIMVKFSCS